MIEEKFVYDNQNNTSTNVFETTTGVLNIAPVKISGNYKVYVSSRKNGYKLYLKDYTERNIALDTTKEFIPQVCNFLQTSVITDDKSKLRYGGFQQKGVKSWHIPLYIGYKCPLPKYFIIIKTKNQSVTGNEQSYLYSGQVIDIIDLSKVYLTNIFEECTKEEYFRFPLIFDFDDKRIDLYGYDAISSSGAVRSFYIKDDCINNPESYKLNDKIVDKFQENNLFFGRFLNLEFEFDYDTNDDDQHFNNFYGFLSYGDLSNSMTELLTKLNNIGNGQTLGNNVCVFVEDTNKNQIITKRIQNTSDQQQTYTLDAGGFYVRDVNVQDYLYTVNAIAYMVGDNFNFYDEDDNLIYQYTVRDSDIKPTKYETFVKIADSITQSTFSMIECNCRNIDGSIIMSFTAIDEYTIDIKSSTNKTLLKSRYKTLDRLEDADNFNKFMNITNNDLMIVGNSDYIDTSIYKYIRINEHIYTIIDNFKYNGKFYVRLDEDAHITSETNAVLIEERLEDIVLMRPIKFMQYDTDLKSTMFCEPYVDDAGNIHAFDDPSNPLVVKYLIKGEYEYVDNNMQNNVPAIDNIVEDNMFFNMCGCSCFITPYVINVWKNFFETAGGLNYDYLNKNRDLYRFNWFLIKGPDYYANKPANDPRHLRYFGYSDDKPYPLLTSRLSKVSSSKCETTFLGVKYQLPIDFKDWQFAVYANIEYSEDEVYGNSSLNYKVIANADNQTVYLVINKYLKYNDFFGLGQRTLDISFLLNVTTSMDDSEPHPQTTQLLGFNIGGVLDDDSYHANNNDWISIQDGLIFIKDSNSGIVFNQYFNDGDDAEFVYPVRLMTGDDLYVDAKLFEVTLKNAQHISSTGLWCEDIIIKFYPEKLYKVNDEGYFELYAEEDDYYQFADSSVRDLVQRFYQMITDIDPNNKVVFYGYQDENDGSYKISFKKNFYRIIYKPDGSVDFEYFDEFYKKPDLDNMSNAGKITWFEDHTNISSDPDGLQSYNGIPHDHDIVYDIFSSNVVMSGIRLLCREIYSTNTNLAAVRQDIEEYSLNTFLQHSIANNLDLIYVDNYDNVTNTGTVKVSAIYPIENSVVWSDENEKKAYFAIKRFNGQYNAYLQGIKGNNPESLFQRKMYQLTGKLFSMYDVRYGRLIGVNGHVNATGIWNEVQGNILSTLFTKDDDIEIYYEPNTSEINYKNVIKEYVKRINNTCYIINNNNEPYLSTLTINIDEYIYERYSLYLLEKQYELADVICDNKRIYYQSNDNDFVVNVDESYIDRKLKFVFKKK